MSSNKATETAAKNTKLACMASATASTALRLEPNAHWRNSAAIDAASDLLDRRLSEVARQEEADIAESNFGATWKDGVYDCPSLGIHSLDGDEWVDNSGKPASGERFVQSRITLVGGPRNGTTVL